MHSHQPPRRVGVNGMHTAAPNKNMVNGQSHGNVAVKANTSPNDANPHKNELAELYDRIEEEIIDQLKYNAELQQCTRENSLYLMGQMTVLLAGVSDLCDYFGIETPESMPEHASITLMPGGRPVRSFRVRGAIAAFQQMCVAHKRAKDEAALLARQLSEAKAQIDALKAERVSLSSLPAPALITQAERIIKKHSNRLLEDEKQRKQEQARAEEATAQEAAQARKPNVKLPAKNQPPARMVTTGQQVRPTKPQPGVFRPLKPLR